MVQTVDKCSSNPLNVLITKKGPCGHVQPREKDFKKVKEKEKYAFFWSNCFISVHRGGARAPPRTPPAPGPFGPLRGTRLALRRALYIEKLEKLDFIINLSKSNF